MVKTALTVAGSDPSGGAGIQADLKVFSAFNVYGMAVITSLTIQNTQGVIYTYPIPANVVFDQIKALAEDISIDVLKLGMLQNAEIVESVALAIKKFNLNLNVVDTVIKSKNDKNLLDKDAIEVFKKLIIPNSYILTPNLPEAQELTQITIETQQDLEKVCKELYNMGSRYVLLKGGHGKDEDYVVDVLYDGESFTYFKYQKVKTQNTHGTGCTYASAIASCLAKGYDVKKAVSIAKAYINGAIINSLQIGRGKGPLNHFWISDLH
jgi:hydroxymethylpyrimidine/phosphomethylpyrimidine kinase